MVKYNGIICNMISFGVDTFEIDVAGAHIKACNQMKVLGSFVDSKLSWDINITKIISKCRSFTVSWRYLRKHLDIKVAIKVFRSHIISKMTYGSPIWSHSMNYNQRLRIRSLLFHIIGIRDFKFKMSKTLLQITVLA